MPELKRKAKKVRAAATDAEEKAKRAQERRDLSAGVDEEEGEGWIHGKGPASAIAEILALPEPWVQAEFHWARRAGRREHRGALMFVDNRSGRGRLPMAVRTRPTIPSRERRSPPDHRRGGDPGGRAVR